MSHIAVNNRILMSGSLLRFPPFIGIAILLSLFAPINAQIVLDGPIKDFETAGFSENGYKSWQLQGKQGVYVNAAQINVSDMILTLFSGDSKVEQTAVIISSKASLRHQSGNALGPLDIQMTGSNYVINGKDWLWYGKERILKIKGGASVVFKGHIGGLLK